MKTISAILFAVVVLTAFKVENSANSIAQKVQGVDVYVYSTPAVPYDVIDRGTIAVASNCENVIEKSARKAADLSANGVIVELPARWVAIKYKQ